MGSLPWLTTASCRGNRTHNTGPRDVRGLRLGRPTHPYCKLVRPFLLKLAYVIGAAAFLIVRINSL
jgi:hypothetical protein